MARQSKKNESKKRFYQYGTPFLLTVLVGMLYFNRSPRSLDSLLTSAEDAVSLDLVTSQNVDNFLESDENKIIDIYISQKQIIQKICGPIHKWQITKEQALPKGGVKKIVQIDGQKSDVQLEVTSHGGLLRRVTLIKKDKSKIELSPFFTMKSDLEASVKTKTKALPALEPLNVTTYLAPILDASATVNQTLVVYNEEGDVVYGKESVTTKKFVAGQKDPLVLKAKLPGLESGRYTLEVLSQDSLSKQSETYRREFVIGQPAFELSVKSLAIYSDKALKQPLKNKIKAGVPVTVKVDLAGLKPINNAVTAQVAMTVSDASGTPLKNYPIVQQINKKLNNNIGVASSVYELKVADPNVYFIDIEVLDKANSQKVKSRQKIIVSL